MKSFQKFFMLFLSAVVMAGCAIRHNVPLSQDFFSKPDTIVIAQVSGIEKPSFYSSGDQGLLGAALSHLMMDEVVDKLRTLDTKKVQEEYYYKQYGNALALRSFKVKSLKDVIYREELQSYSKGIEYAPYDFSFLKTIHNASYALILNPGFFGIRRLYHAFIPLSVPQAYAEFHFYLVKLADNAIVGEYKAVAVEEIQGSWDNPPHYPELLEACQKTLIKALNKAYLFFFTSNLPFKED